mgnify:CR=1 FL=1
MITWNNLDTLESFKELSKVGRVDIKEAMLGDNGAKRVKEYNIPMAEGFTYNFAASRWTQMCLRHLQSLQRRLSLQRNLRHFIMVLLSIQVRTRLVLHQLTRGQLGDAVVADGVDKRITT